jgi:L-seryl-tRNA(Ser) seleniumtransferase
VDQDGLRPGLLLGWEGADGPQSSGLLLGRADLIAGARANNFPSSATIGRGMKVNKEEMLGIMVALESFLQRDHDKEWAEWERRANLIITSVTSVPGVKAENVSAGDLQPLAPYPRHLGRGGRVAVSRADLIKKMRAGEPSILVWSSENALDLGVITLKPGEDRIVARRLKQELSGTA